MNKVYLNSQTVLLTAGLALIAINSGAQTQSFSDTLFFTGAMQQYTIPDCASNVVITTYGAQGASGSVLNPDINSGGLAGLGNRVTAEWSSLSPGQTIFVNVGGAANGANGGYNGGGAGLITNGQNPSGGGGGATDIRYPSDALSDRVQVSGGGGGGGNAAYHWSGGAFTGGNGGHGGGNQNLNGNSLDGTNGQDVNGDSGNIYLGGLGGTTAGPGAGAPGCANFIGSAGGASFGEIGGSGGLGSSLTISGANYRADGGAGGGGYVGGNGGGGGSAGTPNCAGNNISAGGGGSAGTNYFNGEPTNFENGVREGDGLVVIQYLIISELASLSSAIVPCVSQEITLDFSPEGGTFTVIQGNSADLNANGVFNPSEEGTYEIVYSFTDLCTDVTSSDTLVLNITCNNANLAQENNVFTIYPNPAENKLFIESTQQLGDVMLYDVRGQLILSMNATSNLLEIDVNNLESGFYFIQLNGITKRFIVK